MKKYEKLSIKITNVKTKDIITTSGFDGWEQDFGVPTNPTSANMPESMV